MKVSIADILNIKYPIIQAAMGGGAADSTLVCAVSKAGALGSLGFTSIHTFEREIIKIKNTLGGLPYCVNLLVPFVTGAHIECCIKYKVPVVSISFGYKKGLISALKNAGCKVAYQIGTFSSVSRIVDEGVDFVIVQGNEAGGHLCGKLPLSELITKLKVHFRDLPIIAAGGIYNAKTASNTMLLGADGVSCGTRFLMSAESGAHMQYKQKLVQSNKTLVTTLFGFGWHEQHRVLENKATKKWLSEKCELSLSISMINKMAEIVAKYIPDKVQAYIYSRQRLGCPFYTPILPNTHMEKPNIQYAAMYAGKCVSHLNSIETVDDIVKEISIGTSVL